MQYVPKWFFSHPLVHENAGNKLHALLLPVMTTLHNHELPDFASLDYRINRNSDAAHLIMAAELIVWDEAPMMHKYVYEYLDRVLRNITRVDALFGGKVLLLGGDFRQIPTVIHKGSRAQPEEDILLASHEADGAEDQHAGAELGRCVHCSLYCWRLAIYSCAPVSSLFLENQLYQKNGRPLG